MLLREAKLVARKAKRLLVGHFGPTRGLEVTDWQFEPRSDASYERGQKRSANHSCGKRYDRWALGNWVGTGKMVPLLTDQTGPTSKYPAV